MTNRNTTAYRAIPKLNTILPLLMLFSIITTGYSQSPKKYLANGFYEQAFVEAVHKQNKKVKIKKKFVEVIYQSYDTIFARHLAAITSPETDWQHTYNAFVRVGKFRAKVKHPGVYNNLDDVFFHKTALDFVAAKFNETNKDDLNAAYGFEGDEDYTKALELYKHIENRYKQVSTFATLKNRLQTINYEKQIQSAHQRIGDQRIKEAKQLLTGSSKTDAQKAIQLIKEARSHRPLNSAEEELLALANLIIGDSWVAEARKLLNSPTKKNARLAYELINKARSFRTLSAEEEELLETAEVLGMVRILLKMEGENNFNSSESFSGILNKRKSTRWVNYYHQEGADIRFDYELEITEHTPIIELGDRRKRLEQHSKKVEYWEDEVNAAGDTVKVKKERNAIGIIAIMSQTKTASLQWSYTLKAKEDLRILNADSQETIIELKHEYASLESGDILAVPEDIESEVTLDSQPFPSDEKMKTQVKENYMKEILTSINQVLPNL